MKPRAWLSSGCLAALVLPSVALAALGDNATSVAQDKTRMKAALRATAGNSRYTVDEMQMPSGTIVREYASPEGKVFAVTWQGPVQPDLQQILGKYFIQYNEAARAKHAGHNQLAIRRPELVLHSGGHMRAFSGKAYVPQLLPQGVTTDEIR
jgi:hypothetical protein